MFRWARTAFVEVQPTFVEMRPTRRTEAARDRGVSRDPSGILAAVEATGLSATPEEYRTRLEEQSDDQLDAWVAELLRDVVKRRGIVKVVADFRTSTKLGEAAFERVFASGGGAPATLGHDREGHVIVPTISLHALVPGLRARVADARPKLIDYLVSNFGELVYV
jgi:hypothetical protein